MSESGSTKQGLIDRKPFRFTLLVSSACAVIIVLVVLNNFPEWYPASVLRYKREFLGTLITFVVLSYCLWKSKLFHPESLNDAGARDSGLLDFIEKRALILLFIAVCLIVVWLGFVVFKNPYKFGYNHGNGAYFNQLLHNVCKGIGPEHTTKFLTHNLKGNPYFYASSFALAPHLLGFFLVGPLYCLYPYPPMHVFGVVIIVVVFGGFGVYFAIRSLGGSKLLSLVGACVYCVYPWVELPTLYQGQFGNLGYAIYPYVFGFLFSEMWILFYLSVLLLSLINIPYTFSAISLGIVAYFFFKARKQGLICIAIGLLIMLWDTALMREAICGIWSGQAAPVATPSGIFNKFVLGRDIKSLINPFLFHMNFVFELLMTVAFLPLFCIWKKGSRRLQLAGMLFFVMSASAMGMFRSYGWYFHRNANLVVPIYLSGFMAFIDIRSDDNINIHNSLKSHRLRALMCIFFISSLISFSLWYTNHYPWRGLRYLARGPHYFSKANPLDIFAPEQNTEVYVHILSKIDEFVPADASIAYRIEAALQAFITNRQKAWYVGYHPEGVEYYIFQKKKISYIDVHLPPWEDWFEKVEREPRFIKLYEDNILSIYKNSQPGAIPRLESALGWKLLLKALLPGKCENNWQLL